MNEQNKEYFRTRINTKQTSKGEWYLDFTSDEGNSNGINPDIRAKRHMMYLKAIEQAIIEDGRKIVGGK